MTSLKWGILGAGNISGQFVHDLLLNNTESRAFKHIVAAIGCSSDQKGQKFIDSAGLNDANNEGIAPAIQQYADFYANTNVDIVYVGTPHVFHKEQVIECLNHGKHVLCEKPFTINKADSEQLFKLAKEKNLFLMEGVWTRFLPIVNDIESLIFEQKVLGNVFRTFADFSYYCDIDATPEESRIRNRHLGGGALLDIGIYSVTYGRIFLDDKKGENHTPFDLQSVMTVDEKDQVDYNTSILLNYKSGKHGILTTSNHIDVPMPFCRIDGTKGYIEVYAENPARPRSYQVHLRDGTTKKYSDDSPYNGFIYEADAVAKNIANKETENSVMPPGETLLVMDIMDRVRKEGKLVYPSEV